MDRPAGSLRSWLGRRGRNRSVAVYDFSREGPDLTSVELTIYSEPATRSIGRRSGRPGGSGAAGKALERLRTIFEEPPSEPFKRVTIAGYDAAKAARFGAHTGMDPARAPRQTSY